jgi:alpha-N-arabinofuranosidase
VLDAIAVLDEEHGGFTLFAVNRSQDEKVLLNGDMRGVPGFRVIEHLVLEHTNPAAQNSSEHPAEVVPRASGDGKLADGQLIATLSPLSWNVIRMSK